MRTIEDYYDSDNIPKRLLLTAAQNNNNVCLSNDWFIFTPLLHAVVMIRGLA